MKILRDWVAELESLSKDPAQGTLVHQRMLVPGEEPLRMKKGFFSVEPKQAVEAIGKTPRAFSVLTWIGKQTENQLKVAEIGTGIGALLAIITNRRVEVLSEVPLRQEGHPRRFAFTPLTTLPDRSVYGPVDSPETLNKRFKERLSQLCSLSDDDAEAIGAAISLHHGATLLFEEDVAAAYVLLVAAIETLSQRFGFPPSDWKQWDEHVTWEQFISAEGLSDTQSQALRKKLMSNRQIRLKATFANYVRSETPDELWNTRLRDWSFTIVMNDGNATFGERTILQEEPFTKLLPKDRDLLFSAARASYDARSGYVHQGTRVVTLASTLFGLVNGAQAGQPLPFAALRAILRALILKELDSRSSDFKLPGVRHELSS